MMKRRPAVVTMVLVALLVCVSPLFAGDYQLSLIKKFYSMGTASINGTYYPVGNSIARLLSKQIKGLVALAEPTAGSMANIEYLRRNQIDLALIQSDVAWLAHTGSHNFPGGKFRELRVLASLYSEMVQIIVREDSDIRTIRDLKGRKIAVGDRESGGAASVMLVLEAAGLKETDYTIVYERFTRATEELGDGYVDAVYYAGGVPADGITRLAGKVPVRLVAVPQNVRASLIARYPYFTSEVIARGAYKGQNNEVSTVGFRALLAGTENLPASEVTEMLRVIYDNIPAISDQNQRSIALRLEDALQGVEPEMLHEGAKRFFIQRNMMQGKPVP